MRIEQIARVPLYANAPFEVIYNPLDGYEGDPEVVDLSYDIANIHQVTHFKTAEVRALLAKAKLVVADSAPLANLVKNLPGVIVTSLPFGRLETTSRQSAKSDQTTFGLLAQDDIYLAAASFGRKMLTKLNIEQLHILGEGVKNRLTLTETDVEEMDDIHQFAASVDVVLVPGHPNSLISPTIAHALAEAGCVFVYSVRSLAILNNSGGNFYIPDVSKVGEWNKAVKTLQSRNALFAARIRNQNYFKRANTNSQGIIPRIKSKLNG